MQQKKYEVLRQQVIEWASERDLLKRENAPKQYLKFLEELGETAFGDVLVTLIILNEQLGNKSELTFPYLKSRIRYDLSDIARRVMPTFINPSVFNFLRDIADSHGNDLIDCLEFAYKQIKDRKGKTINGNFVKDNN
jgi:hypothetical protein